MLIFLVIFVMFQPHREHFFFTTITRKYFCRLRSYIRMKFLFTKRAILIILGFAIVGAAVGYSQVLCPDGYCPLTGSWPGGTAAGAMVGLVVAGA